MRHTTKPSLLLSLRWHESGCPALPQVIWGQDGVGTSYRQKEGKKKSIVTHPVGFYRPSCHFHHALWRDAPINAATAIRQLWLVAAFAEHPPAAVVSCRYEERCFTAEMLSLAALVHFRTLLSIQIQEGDGFQGEEAQMLGNPGRRLI